MNIFEKATRLKLRFSSTPGARCAGSLSVEDIWEMHLESLDPLYRELNKKKQMRTEGLLERPTAEDELNDLRMAIIKHVFDVKVAEREKAKSNAARRQKREKIMEAMANKQDADLHSKSLEDLQKLLDAEKDE